MSARASVQTDSCSTNREHQPGFEVVICLQAGNERLMHINRAREMPAFHFYMTIWNACTFACAATGSDRISPDTVDICSMGPLSVRR